MTRAELLALAERVEAATGPDRELDAEIVAATTPGVVGIDYSATPQPGWTERLFVFDPPRRWSESFLPVPHYMSSRDAAASLLPPGYVVEVIGCDGHSWHCGTYKRSASAAALAKSASGPTEVGDPILMLEGNAKDEPRARLAAALRAWAEEAGDE